MVIRVHDNAAVSRTNAEPAVSACFAEGNVFVIFVADSTDGSTAANVNFSKFARRQTEKCIVAFLSHQLSACAGRTDHLAAFADLQFYVVNDGTKRNVGEWEAVADFNIGFRTAGDYVADLQTFRSEDVAFFTICILQQCDAAGTVWIVFNGCDFSRNAIFISLEIDDSVLTFMSAALVTNGGLTGAITTAMIVNRSQKGFFWGICCNFLKGGNGHLTASGSVRFK